MTGLCSAVPAYANPAFGSGGTRALTLHNLRFNERTTFLLGRNEFVSSEAHRELNWLMRDHHNGSVGNMDPELISHLMDLQQVLEQDDVSFEIVSAYRSAKTNRMLREHSPNVATYSLHMSGRAIDIRLPNVPMKELRDAALDLRVGGVGYYPGFVHFDTGPRRHW